MITIRIRQRRNGLARPLAEVGMIAIGLNDPVIPAQLLEADVQGLPAALAGGVSALQGSAPAALACVLRIEDQEWPVFFVEGERRSA